jgi:hypothetical protein
MRLIFKNKPKKILKSCGDKEGYKDSLNSFNARMEGICL